MDDFERWQLAAAEAFWNLEERLDEMPKHTPAKRRLNKLRQQKALSQARKGSSHKGGKKK